jgi:hypothetical protein
LCLHRTASIIDLEPTAGDSFRDPLKRLGVLDHDQLEAERGEQRAERLRAKMPDRHRGEELRHVALGELGGIGEPIRGTSS